MSDLIKREDAIGAINEWLKRNHFPNLGEGILYLVPSADRPQEWIDCKEPPSTDRNVFIAYGTDDMKSVCIGHYEHDMKLWYEDRNFFAKPKYDAMYWCEIPQFPTRVKGADDE